jgi:spermidine synthase
MTPPPQRFLFAVGGRLFLASFAALALEMALIRWLPAHIRVVSYFPNLVLIAAFLGLGLGALTRLRWTVLGGVIMLVTTLATLALGRIAFTAGDTGEHLWLLYYDLPAGAPVVRDIVTPLAVVFVLVTAIFLQLGREIATRLEAFRSAGRPLPGYSIDLLGSLAGVLTFLGLSALATRPVIWFGLAFAAWLLVSDFHWRRRAVLAACFIASLGAIYHYDNADLYSPYYAIRIDRSYGAVAILTNGSLHQVALDLRRPAKVEERSLFIDLNDGTHIRLEDIREGYRYHVDHLDRPPQRALVLGAGTGNDVAALLDAGVPEVHVVEIDPVILELGRKYHPSHPYDDPRVTLHNDDARLFLERTPLRFDLIVFGTLDSMTRLSALANVRLDNFVYTEESLKAARARLTEQGGVALMFMVSNPRISAHLFAILDHAFGEPPLIYRRNYGLFNTMFLAGAGFSRLRSDPSFHDIRLETARKLLRAPSDDWPYLYLDAAAIPVFYFKIAGVVLATTLLFFVTLSAAVRHDLLAGRIDGEMLTFGAAFLLVETSMVTEMNLLFGTLWRTNAIVFGSILFALLASTLLSAWRRVDARWSLIAVALSLCVVAYLPLRQLAPSGDLSRILYAAFICGFPVFCAGLAFADRFATRPDAERAFGWNIIGAVFGGLLEFLTMLLGLHALFLIGAVLYLLLLMMRLRRRTAGNSPLPAS